MRVAAARAATRLGSKTKIFPPLNQRFPSREHIIAKGSAVVFPAPGGACKIKSLFSFSKRTRKQSSMTSLIGSCDICSRTRSFSNSFTSFSHFPFPIGGSGVVKLLLLLLLLVEDVKKLLFLLQHVFPLAKATLCLLSFLMLLVKRLSET
jgi:hypothetical protein